METAINNDYVIVMDSCGEITEEMRKEASYISAPLTLQVGDWSGMDDETFDQADFLRRVAAYENAPKSACPSPDFFRKSYLEGEKRAYGVTLSAELSGSYSSAILARELALDEEPEKEIYVFNSRSASVGESLIGRKIAECEAKGMAFDEVVQTVEQYIEDQHTGFVLENLDTLRKNGRLSNMKAFLATALKIKPVLAATPDGQITQVGQARGLNKALQKLAEYMVSVTENPQDKILAISHCNNYEKAIYLRDEILALTEVKDVMIVDMHGVSTMYAADQGIICVM